jgi:hypothetical protein
MTTVQTFSGGCHCGAVRFEVDVARDLSAEAHPPIWLCNCSICDMTGFQHLIVDSAHFRLISGSERLSEYRFNTGSARHLFCSVCGIKSFYVPRSHPDGYSVNVRCLDGHPLAGVEPRPFDGQRWEQSSGAFQER